MLLSCSVIVERTRRIHYLNHDFVNKTSCRKSLNDIYLDYSNWILSTVFQRHTTLEEQF